MEKVEVFDFTTSPYFDVMSKDSKKDSVTAGIHFHQVIIPCNLKSPDFTQIKAYKPKGSLINESLI